jgi:selenocysteine lyase/cysteine desulfurase
MLGIPDVADRFHGRGYLDTGSIGLPPDTTVAAMSEAMDEWWRGAAHAPAYDEHVEQSRGAFAGLVGVDAGWVATGSVVSPLTGLIAASLPAGAEVLCPDGEFTSVLFPFLARQGLTVRLAPLEALADQVTERTTLVAFSAVQSADGRVADLGAISEAAARHGARTFVDVTQAAGWLPLRAADYDYVVAGAYKWLLCPRGSSFLVVRPEHQETLVPLFAGWYAGDDRWDAVYGAPLRLAHDARRLDISPAWLAWVGTVTSLELVAEIGVAAIHDHDVALANELRSHLGLPPSNSAMVSLGAPGAADALRTAGIRASDRAGRARLCFHIYNDEQDVAAAAAALSR